MTSTFKVLPGHLDPATASSQLTNNSSSFSFVNRIRDKEYSLSFSPWSRHFDNQRPSIVLPISYITVCLSVRVCLSVVCLSDSTYSLLSYPILAYFYLFQHTLWNHHQTKWEFPRTIQFIGNLIIQNLTIHLLQRTLNLSKNTCLYPIELHIGRQTPQLQQIKQKE